MKVAIVHYWFVTMRGGERVVERLLGLYPSADIFTHVFDPEAVSDIIRSRPVKTTFISRLPNSRRLYKKYLPLMPMALEALDLTDYDLVISSEAGPAKGVITRPDALHVCYCHSPMRYIWDQQFLYRRQAGWLTRLAMPFFATGLRQWDVAAAARVDAFVANSAFVASRIRKFYRREAEVAHPPVDIDAFAPCDEVGDSYLWVGQLVAYKRPELAVDAFNQNGRRLTIVGVGEMESELKRRAGPNITFVPRLSFDDLRRAYATAKALVFTAEEDFGISPVEAMASGRPVIAYGRGGALETVVDGVTGLFFNAPTIDGLNDAIEAFERWEPSFRPQRSIERARDFAASQFDAAFTDIVERAFARLRDGSGTPPRGEAAPVGPPPRSETAQPMLLTG